MEESIDLAAFIRESFCVKEVDIRTYSPLTLAFIGDGIYDLIIRTILVSKGNESTNRLQHKTASYVKAGTQSAMIRALMPYLTEEELAIYTRRPKTQRLRITTGPRDLRRWWGIFICLEGPEGFWRF